MDSLYTIKVKAPRRRHWIDYIIFSLGAMWLLQGKYILGIVHVILEIAGYAANRKSTVRFNSRGIYYPSFPPKIIRWKDVQNVLLKDGILTIDLINNKLYQLVAHDADSAEKIEADFNAFASEMMAGASTADPILN